MITLIAIAFDSLVLLVVPFILLVVYVFACVVMGRTINNVLLSSVCIVNVVVATLYFAALSLLSSMGLAPTLYFAAIGIVMAVGMIENRIEKLMAAKDHVMDWLKPTPTIENAVAP